MEQTAAPAPERSWLNKIGDAIAPAAAAMLGDAALFLLGLLILAISFLGLLGLQSLHYSAKHIEVLEGLHFWGFFAVLAELLLDLIWKIAAHALNRKRG